MANYYKILKVLNNSSLLVSDGYNESIIIGTGIGFKRKVNEELDQTILVEKEFHLLKDSDYQSQSQVPKRIINNTAEIVDIVSGLINHEVSEHSTISLSNHVAAMLVRIENDEVFANPFHHETITLYPEGYQIALVVAAEVKKRTEIVLPEAEIDFLTLYIHGIRSGYDNQNIALRNAIISEVSEVLEDQLGFKVDMTSAFYARFITHIKFLIQRLTKNEPIASIPMIQSVVDQYPEYMEMSEAIAKVIGEQLQEELSVEEHAYIALHLARLTFNSSASIEEDNTK